MLEDFIAGLNSTHFIKRFKTQITCNLLNRPLNIYNANNNKKYPSKSPLFSPNKEPTKLSCKIYTFPSPKVYKQCGQVILLLVIIAIYKFLVLFLKQNFGLLYFWKRSY